MVPFIHLFRSPNSGYFYDVNKDKVVCVNDHLYAFLSETKDIPENVVAVGNPCRVIRKNESEG